MTLSLRHRLQFHFYFELVYLLRKRVHTALLFFGDPTIWHMNLTSILAVFLEYLLRYIARCMIHDFLLKTYFPHLAHLLGIALRA